MAEEHEAKRDTSEEEDRKDGDPSYISPGVPKQGKIVTTEDMDEKLAIMNKLIHSKDCLLPSTIDASMAECDEFMNLVDTFLQQKLLLARKCLHMTHFVEDIYQFAALAFTPLLTLIVFGALVWWSKAYTTPVYDPEALFPHGSTIFNIPLPVPKALKPFLTFVLLLSPFPVLVYYLSMPKKGAQEPMDPVVNPDEIVDSLYPKLKGYSDMFHSEKERKKILTPIWGVTGVLALLLLGAEFWTFLLRLIGLALVAAFNYVFGLALTRFPTFAKAVDKRLTPVEKVVRVMSLSPIYQAMLAAGGTVVSPLITQRIDFDHLREKALIFIAIVQKKFQAVLAVQQGMRNVRSCLKFSTHGQDLLVGITRGQLDREAGRKLAGEVPKLANALLGWGAEKFKQTYLQPNNGARNANLSLDDSVY